MSGDVHVRFCERLEGRVLGATRLVVLCARDIEPSLTRLRDLLRTLGLSLKEEKTKGVNAWEEPFDFLGFSFGMKQGRLRGKWYPHVEPSPQSIQRFKARVTQRTTRRLTPIPLSQVVETLNQYVRGWAGYFHYRKSSTVFGRVKWHLEERRRTHLRKRHKLKSWAAGYEQFPNQRLYARHGLFKLPTTAGWTRTHA